MSELLKNALAYAQRFLDSIPTRPVRATASLAELRRSIGGELPAKPRDANDVLGEIVAAIEPGLVATPSPRYYGFVIGGTLPVALAADWMTSTWDQNPGIYATSPATAVVEEVVSEWVVDLLRLPKGSSVGFVTGCQMANFTALAAARHGVLARAGWNVEDDGLAGAPNVNIVLGAEAHVTIHTALRYLGFGLKSALLVDTDDQGRMKPNHLKQVLSSLSGPTIVCAQAGNVNTGSVDPLNEIGAIARERGAWLHVDGAFGLWAAAAPARRHLVEGADLASSWATDAHKWLNVPYDCGIVIVSDPAVHRGAMSVKAAYLQQTAGEERDNLDYVPEFSRRARSFTVYAALRALGREGVADLVERLCQRASQFAALLSREPGIEILNDVVLNQVLVRFESSDEVTRAVIAEVQRGDVCWLGGTTWHERAAMRISVSNWQTSEDDVVRSVEEILRAKRAVGSG